MSREALVNLDWLPIADLPIESGMQSTSPRTTGLTLSSQSEEAAS